MTEIFKDIPGYEELYQVSNKGRVKSLNYNKTGKEQILKTGKLKTGYLFVSLYKDRKRKNFLIHRLVAEAFLPNPDNKSEVNHRDETPNHNWLENLEWCDRKYNINYGNCKEKISKSMTNNPKISTHIKCLDLETNKTTIYPSIREAARLLNLLVSSICASMYKCKRPYKNRYIFSEVSD